MNSILKELIGTAILLGVAVGGSYALTKAMHTCTTQQYQTVPEFKKNFDKGFRLTHPDASNSDISNVICSYKK